MSQEIKTPPLLRQASGTICSIPRCGLTGRAAFGPMGPELRRMNVEHFRKLLDRTSDPAERARLEALIAEELAKPDSAYPRRRAES